MHNVRKILEPWIIEQMNSDGPEYSRAILNDQETLKSKILDYATSKSAFYRERIGCNYNHTDWHLIPFTTAEDLRTRGLEMLCCSQDQIKRVVTLETSGTMGSPKRIYCAEEDQKRSIEYFRVGMDTFTHLKDKVLILLPCEREGSIGKLLGEALELSGKIPYLHGVVKNLSETFELIEKIKPDVIVGIPFQVLALVKYGLFMNKEIKTVKKMLLSTDWVSETAIGMIAQYWNCEVFRYYGMTESGFGGGIECAQHEGYHLYESDFYIEIIDPNTGKCLPDGETGEIVITTLKREGMPLIRYRTGDQSRIIPELCTCGSKVRRLDLIKSRLKGQIKLNGDDYLTKGEVDDVLLDIKSLLDYKIQLISALDKICIHLEIYYLSDRINEEVIIDRLRRIDAIKRALDHNDLEIRVNSIKVNTDYCPHPAKRKIEE